MQLLNMFSNYHYHNAAHVVRAGNFNTFYLIMLNRAAGYVDIFPCSLPVVQIIY